MSTSIIKKFVLSRNRVYVNWMKQKIPDRFCLRCGVHLPDTSHPSRKYCHSCARYHPVEREFRVCASCGKKFSVFPSSHRTTCGSGCQNALLSKGPDGWIGNTGAARELIASAWLIGQGYLVARNLVPYGPADIIAYSAERNELYLIDVKSGHPSHIPPRISILVMADVITWYKKVNLISDT